MRRVSDKRRHPRYEGTGLWARVKVDGALVEAEVENVSLGGALLRLARWCDEGRNVMLELRGSQRDLRVVGRIVGVLPRGRGRTRPAARIRFNASSERHTEQLYALIRGLPADAAWSSHATDPEAFEFHELKLEQLDPDETFDIDVEEPEFELIEAVEEPTFAG